MKAVSRRWCTITISFVPSLDFLPSGGDGYDLVERRSDTTLNVNHKTQELRRQLRLTRASTENLSFISIFYETLNS